MLVIVADRSIKKQNRCLYDIGNINGMVTPPPIKKTFNAAAGEDEETTEVY